MNEGSLKRAGAESLRGRERVTAARPFLAPVAVALVALAAMLIVAGVEGLPLRDPDARYVGSPLALIGLIALLFLILDLIPRAVRANREEGKRYLDAAWELFRERWWGSRGAIVLTCLLSFYVTYLSYRNLKSFVPFVTDGNHDQALLEAERFFFFGSDPAVLLHDILGTGAIAHLLSVVYLAFLTFVPVSIAVALIWSSRLRAGVWYVTTLSIAWLLGALSYFLVPAMGPVYADRTLFYVLPDTGVSRLQNTLFDHRAEVLFDPHASTAVQSIAAFASLHIAVIFAAALLAHLVGAPRPLRIGLWTFLGLTAIATIYFGWHYVIDDVAGLAIGAFAVLAAARLMGIELSTVGRRVPAAQRSASAT
jgi:hypothetical protein